MKKLVLLTIEGVAKEEYCCFNKKFKSEDHTDVELSGSVDDRIKSVRSRTERCTENIAAAKQSVDEEISPSQSI